MTIKQESSSGSKPWLDMPIEEHMKMCSGSDREAKMMELVRLLDKTESYPTTKIECIIYQASYDDFLVIEYTADILEPNSCERLVRIPDKFDIITAWEETDV